MKFTAVLALAMASVAVAAPADFSVTDVEKRTGGGGGGSHPPSGGSSPCSDNRVQVNVQETQGVLGLVSIVGQILNNNGGGSFCCDAGAPQFGLINLSALNCVKIL